MEKVNAGLENVDYYKLKPVYQSIKEVKKLMKNYNKPLIGFLELHGQLAAYLVEGTITKDLAIVKEMAYKDPELMRTI